MCVYGCVSTKVLAPCLVSTLPPLHPHFNQPTNSPPTSPQVKEHTVILTIKCVLFCHLFVCRAFSSFSVSFSLSFSRRSTAKMDNDLAAAGNKFNTLNIHPNKSNVCDAATVLLPRPWIKGWMILTSRLQNTQINTGRIITNYAPLTCRSRKSDIYE